MKKKLVVVFTLFLVFSCSQESSDSSQNSEFVDGECNLNSVCAVFPF